MVFSSVNRLSAIISTHWLPIWNSLTNIQTLWLTCIDVYPQSIYWYYITSLINFVLWILENAVKGARLPHTCYIMLLMNYWLVHISADDEQWWINPDNIRCILIISWMRIHLNQRYVYIEFTMFVWPAIQAGFDINFIVSTPAPYYITSNIHTGYIVILSSCLLKMGA